jgi:4-hydroxy-4-methyl-2-oxoglutarate aldolase
VSNNLTRLRALYTPVVCDALDSLGLRDCAMDPGLTRIAGEASIAGTAATLEVIAVDSAPVQPYKLQFEAIDAIEPDQIVIVSAPNVSSAFWGELITTGAKRRGGVGAVVDGYSRDTAKVQEHGFGVWARGTHPADSLGRLNAINRNVPVACGGVDVVPGDYILCDRDGIVVVPQAVIAEVLDLAESKVRAEDTVRGMLASGATIAETYAAIGVM